MNRSVCRTCIRGSIFMETMLTIMLVGIAVAALMEFMTNSTAAHGSIQQLQHGTDLANAALEYAAIQPFDTLGRMETSPQQFSPPVNAQGLPLVASQGWSQELTAKSVSDDSLRENAAAGSTPALWITVTVRQNGKAVYSHSRLQTRAL